MPVSLVVELRLAPSVISCEKPIVEWSKFLLTPRSEVVARSTTNISLLKPSVYLAGVLSFFYCLQIHYRSVVCAHMWTFGAI